MKKKVTAIVAAAILVILAIGGVVLFMLLNQPDRKSVSYNGQLRVDGNRIVNQHNEEVQLTGISTHGIQWYGDLYNETSIAELKNEFGINVFRIAMYVNPDDGGYIGNRGLKDKVVELVEAAIKLDMYAIIDWHILNDNNPQTYEAEALEFFGEMSEKYGETPNVIYEICNEPNGSDVSWGGNIRPYAEKLVAKIREHAKKAIVIVGTPNWSKAIEQVDPNPLDDKNVAYALHFYAGSENVTLRDEMDHFRSKNLALFVSECGSTDASGQGDLHEDNFKVWIDYLNKNKISWVFWAFSNKDEASSIVTEKYKPGVADDETGLENYLTENGRLLKRTLVPPED